MIFCTRFIFFHQIFLWFISFHVIFLHDSFIPMWFLHVINSFPCDFYGIHLFQCDFFFYTIHLFIHDSYIRFITCVVFFYLIHLFSHDIDMIPFFTCEFDTILFFRLILTHFDIFPRFIYLFSHFILICYFSHDSFISLTFKHNKFVFTWDYFTCDLFIFMFNCLHVEPGNHILFRFIYYLISKVQIQGITCWNAPLHVFLLVNTLLNHIGKTWCEIQCWMQLQCSLHYVSVGWHRQCTYTKTDWINERRLLRVQRNIILALKYEQHLEKMIMLAQFWIHFGKIWLSWHFLSVTLHPCQWSCIYLCPQN